MTDREDILRDLVEEFAELVVLQDDADTAEEGNLYVEQWLAVWRRLVEEYGDDGRVALSALFHDPRRKVQLNAAVMLLRYKHDEAVALLEEIGKGKDLDAFCARQSLKNYADGSWELDLVDE